MNKKEWLEKHEKIISRLMFMIKHLEHKVEHPFKYKKGDKIKEYIIIDCVISQLVFRDFHPIPDAPNNMDIRKVNYNTYNAVSMKTGEKKSFSEEELNKLMK